MKNLFEIPESSRLPGFHAVMRPGELGQVDVDVVERHEGGAPPHHAQQHGVEEKGAPGPRAKPYKPSHLNHDDLFQLHEIYLIRTLDTSSYRDIQT